MSKTHKFAVHVTKTVIVEFNDSIMPDDDWRRHFYRSIRSPTDLAEHLAFNYVANGIDKLTQLDGFADQKDRFVKFKDGDWECDTDPCTK